MAAAAVMLSTASVAEATWPGREGRIALMVDDESAADYESRIVTVERDGSDPFVVHHCRPSAASREPCVSQDLGSVAWSPEGRRLAVQIGGRIAVVNADGSDWRLVTDGSGFDSEPAWSADGREVAFTRSRGDLGEDVFAVSADGTRLRQITRGAQVSDVAWSSRNQLAYVSSVGKVRIVKADRRGRHRRVLATVPDARFLDWSPDGNRLLFTRSGPRADGASTWSVDRRGMRARLEARGVTNAFWSPTGRRIASEGNFTFILSRLDGSRRRPIGLQVPPGWGFAKPQAWQSVRR